METHIFVGIPQSKKGILRGMKKRGKGEAKRKAILPAYYHFVLPKEKRLAVYYCKPFILYIDFTSIGQPEQSEKRADLGVSKPEVCTTAVPQRASC
ncbi:hypothetical protein [Pseudodesulfovibrio tunisiensis]|uniref:hypothetical protein n=1 Tax=Pseudodesulfovibrio tunisiensis TaxID=463192 RepID=UPI001FB562BA|nr:hypothetical protein [Pseudodesulfovibrio tunisiensis]